MAGADWVRLAGLSVLWGASFFFIKLSVAALPPLTVVLIRVGLAAAALWLVASARGLAIPTVPAWWHRFAVMGLLNNLIPFSLIFWGETQISSGLAAILNATTPLFAAVLAHFLTRDERLTTTRLAGVLAGLAGVMVMVGPAALADGAAPLLPQLAVLAAALSYGCSGLYGRRFRELSPIIAAAGQLTASTLMMAPLALLADRPWTLAAPGPETLAALAGLALLSTALAYILFFRILASAGATNVMLVTLLIPVSALLLGTGLLGESLGPAQLAGMALIGTGLAAIDGRLLCAAKRWSARRSRLTALEP